MIFKKLVFDNYKTFYGHQNINFDIPEQVRKDKERNIILLGGLNGSGKTTILKAITYVLFGQRGISEEEHKKLFSNAINNTFFEEGGRTCYVILTIETDKKEEWELKVVWKFDNTKRVTDEHRSIVVRNLGEQHGRHAQIDNINAYNRFIDKIIPYYAAPFFIFDGEEIKNIILRQNSSEMKDAIHKITGMDATKQLLTDLKSIKKDVERELANSLHKTDIEKLKNEFEETEKKIEELEIKVKKANKAKSSLEQKVSELKQSRANKISQNINSQGNIAKKQGTLEHELEIVTKNIKDHFINNVILIILNRKIQKLMNRLKYENTIEQKQFLIKASLEPYEKFINQLLKYPLRPPLSSEQLSQIKKIGEEIWIKEKHINNNIPDDEQIIHDLSKNNYYFLVNLPSLTKDPLVNLINKKEKLTMDIKNLEQKMRNAPATVDYSYENQQIDYSTRALGELERTIRIINKKLTHHLEEKSNVLNKITRHETKPSSTTITLKLEQINKLINAIDEYINKSTEMKAKFIKDSFTDMLSKLIRKKDEFGGVEFDINTYTIKLYNDKDQEVSVQDRSAGEMQMISSALIWALTKASDIPLPMVIDTPLGRLDSFHRVNLINNYYKELSDQVIILSTDTEISQDYIEFMKKNTYHQYTLDYDQNKKYTIIRDGYFNFSEVK